MQRPNKAQLEAKENSGGRGLSMEKLLKPQLDNLEEWASELFANGSGFAKQYAHSILLDIRAEKHRRANDNGIEH
jgi:hypothetical protein